MTDDEHAIRELASVLTQLAGHAAFEHLDCWSIGRVREIEADDLGGLAVRGVVVL